MEGNNKNKFLVDKQNYETWENITSVWKKMNSKNRAYYSALQGLSNDTYHIVRSPMMLLGIKLENLLIVMDVNK